MQESELDELDRIVLASEQAGLTTASISFYALRQLISAARNAEQLEQQADSRDGTKLIKLAGCMWKVEQCLRTDYEMKLSSHLEDFTKYLKAGEYIILRRDDK